MKTLTPNEQLMGAEAKSRADFEEALQGWRHADRLPGFDSVQSIEADALTILVLYHPERGWRYEFAGMEGWGLRGRFDNRDSCLSALTAHSPAVA